MVSKEVFIGFVIIVTVLLCVALAFNLTAAVEAQRKICSAFSLLPMFVISFISALAENKPCAPSDRFTCELRKSEFVAGFFC